MNNKQGNADEKIEKEADFYGAMDGASKFVKGDAIASIIIVLINLFAGFIIGMAYHGCDAMESLENVFNPYDRRRSRQPNSGAAH